MPIEGSYFTDANFVDEILHLIVNDRDFLRGASHLLTREDFRQHGGGVERPLAAAMALNFWKQYREPIGKFLRVELADFARRKQFDDARKERLLEYGHVLTNGHKRIAPDAILDKVRQYKLEHKIALTMQQLQELMERGELTPENFITLARQAVEQAGYTDDLPTDIFDRTGLETRISRRGHQAQYLRFPVLLIDPIDRLGQAIAREHVGLVLAPYGRGKSLFLIWVALAYALQGLNVLHFTLEDPRNDVEDRFDAAISALPISRLADVPNHLRLRFERYTRRMRAKVKVVDGTDGLTTIEKVENVFEQERNRGFLADAVIIDYDDEIRPMQKRNERRFEFADIYKDFRALLARHKLLGWTASQTKRETDDMKIIRGRHVAEDISKMRKAHFSLSLGKGEWGEDSIYAWIEKSRADRDHQGANFLTAKEKGLIYDREKTLKKEALERTMQVDGVVQ